MESFFIETKEYSEILHKIKISARYCSIVKQPKVLKNKV